MIYCKLFLQFGAYFPLVNGPFMVTLNVDVIASRNYSPSDRSWLTSYCTLFDIAFLYSTCIKSYKIISSFVLILMFLSLQTSHKLILYYTLVPCCIVVLSFSYKDEEKSNWLLPGKEWAAYQQVTHLIVSLWDHLTVSWEFCHLFCC